MFTFHNTIKRMLALLCVLTCADGSFAADTTTQGELPSNPNLTSPIPSVPDAVTESEVRRALENDFGPRVRVGINAGVSSRPSAADGADYGPGFAWGGHANVVFLPWLSLRLGSLLAGYNVSPNEGAWGLTHVDADPPPMRELSLRGEVELRRSVAPRLSVWGVVGFGWARVSMATFTLREPYPASVEMRSGSVLEVPLGAGIGYDLWDKHLALTLDFRVVPAVSQTGDYFEPQTGQGETVRSDTGTRVTLRGLPELRAATLALLGLEASF